MLGVHFVCVRCVCVCVLQIFPHTSPHTHFLCVKWSVWEHLLTEMLGVHFVCVRWGVLQCVAVWVPRSIDWSLLLLESCSVLQCVRWGVCVCVCVCVLLWEHLLTGWRRNIGCLKLQVSFRKRATNYRALLQKETCKDKASYASSPPCKTLQMHFKVDGRAQKNPIILAEWFVYCPFCVCEMCVCFLVRGSV